MVSSEDKILAIIRPLNPNKAHGWDETSIRMIKLSDVSLVTPLEIIFTNCLRNGVVPEVWKCANVVPVYKKNEKNLKVNYRPISLLPMFGKILEKLVYNSLYSHLVSCRFFNPNQSGFRPGDSTINQLLSITHFMKHLTINLHLTLVLYTWMFLKHLIEFGMMTLSIR